MLNNIAIGTLVTLDMQTRTLTRLQDGESVTLPASACLCLQALTEAQGEVLSQEQLMDIGWRSAGVEVTENSVRVMINKLRRALNTLELQDAITLLAVTRSGYRLIVRDDTPALQEPLLQSASAPVAAVTYSPASRPVPRRPTKRIIAGLCGIAAGLAVAAILHALYIVTPESVTFVRWNGPGIPPDAEVMVPKEKQHEQAIIEATLQTYTSHVLNRRPMEKPARVLYLTIGDPRATKHQGLIACQQPFQDGNNDCESFYFRFY